jgi:hypothetical protein
MEDKVKNNFWDKLSWSDLFNSKFEVFKYGTSLAFLIGVFCLAPYFYSINYLPVNTTSFIYIIFIAAFVGIIIISFITLGIIMTQKVWSDLLSMEDSCRIIVGEKRYKNVEQIACDKLSSPAIRVRIFFAYIYSLTFWFFIFFGLIDKQNKWALILSLPMFIVYTLYSFYLFVSWRFRFPSNNKVELTSKALRIFRGYFYLIQYSFISSLMLIIYLALILAITKNYGTVLFVATLGTSLILLPVNYFWNGSLGKILIGLTTCLVLICISMENGNFSKMIVQLAHLGAFENRIINVDFSGCQIFANKGYKVSCQAGVIASIKPVNILWGVGEEVYLSFKSMDGIEHRIRMHSENIRAIE